MSLYIMKAFGRLVSGETFYSVVSLYIDHQRALLRSSKAHRCKLLRIKKNQTKQRQMSLAAQSESGAQATTSFLWSSQLLHFSLASNNEKPSVCSNKVSWLSSLVNTYIPGVIEASLGGYIAEGLEITTNQSDLPLIGFWALLGST